MAAPPLRLASRSPRRREILRAAGIDFCLVDVEVDETPPSGQTPAEVAAHLARTKAAAGALQFPQDLVLGADTIVALDGQCLGKPTDDEDARRMLRALSGRQHHVFTGFALVRGHRARVWSEVVGTIVRMRPIRPAEIDEFVASGEGRDKAGSYGIQGAAGAFVDSIEGSYANVVGLPIERLIEVLADIRKEEESDG